MALLADRETKGYAPVSVAAGIDRRMEFLSLSDRKLLETALSGKLTWTEIALLAGQSVGTITRRARRLLNRLHDPLIVALIERGDLLPEMHKVVGLAFFLRKTPLEKIAMEAGISEYAVRRMIAYIRGWFSNIQSQKSY